MSGPRSDTGRTGWVASLFGGRRERETHRRREAASQTALARARESTDVLERILDTIDQAVLLLDATGSPRLSNRAARQILSLEPRGTSPALAALGLPALAVRAAGAGEAVIAERELHVPNRRTLSIRVEPFGDGSLALIDDVTSEQRNDQVRRDFVANVSHELKTPIAGIALLAEQLADAIREDPAAAERFAERIRIETERMTNLVVDLLDLSRIESDLPFAPADVPARAIADDALVRVSALAEAKEIDIEVRIDGDPVVRADAVAATTAVSNLLDNAVRYSPERSPVVLSIRADGDEVSFVVQDRGPGIPTQELGRIFERFYRVDKARARTTGGTGLGLAIVKHVAERHGGRVYAAGEFGRGSVFTLVLPAGGPV